MPLQYMSVLSLARLTVQIRGVCKKFFLSVRRFSIEFEYLGEKTFVNQLYLGYM